MAEAELNASFDPTEMTDLSAMLSTLSKMKDIFESVCVPEVEPEVEPVPATKVPRLCRISFSDAEEKWLQRKFSTVRSEFESVALPESLMWQAVGLLSKSPPTSKEFSANIFAVMVERVHRVLKRQPEFRTLTETQQVSMLLSQFSAISTILGEKLAFSSKTSVMIKILHFLALF
jgi:hypothetical protein